VQIDYASRTHVGHIRERNEDAWGAWGPCGRASRAPVLLAVADGMGGHPGGDVAGSLAVRTAGRFARYSWAEPAVEMARLFQAASLRLRTWGRRDPSRREMGTTLTVAFLREGLAWVGHVGDTRLHWIRDGQEMQVTTDHTVAQEMIEAGLLDRRVAEEHPSSHVLTRCLGVCTEQAPDVLLTPLRLEAGDRLLLCSDGLVRTIPNPDLARLVAGAVEVAAGVLLETALAAGAPDNVTFLLASVVDPGPSSGRKEIALFGGRNGWEWAGPPRSPSV
jgi:serine/threonine protein phosphatase PrpC